MSSIWRQAYSELVGFISEHPEIKIAANYVMIPAKVRPDFYRFFDAVRTAFMTEKFQDLLDDARCLSLNYAEIENEVIRLLELEIVSLDIELRSFLNDPGYELRKGLFSLMFDLLRRRIDLVTFEEMASRDVATRFGCLHRMGYMKWLELCLIKMVAPERVLNIPIPDLKPDAPGIEEVPGRANRLESAPEETKHLSLEHKRLEMFIVPDLIIRSSKVGRYVAIRTELGNADCTVSNPSIKGEWLLLESMENECGPLATWPDIIVNLGDEPEELALVADFGGICRPDLIIECKGQKEWYEKEGLNRVKLHHHALRPKLGTWIVSREPVSGQAFKELMSEQVSEETTPEGVPKESEKPVFEIEQELVPEEKCEKQGEAIHILTVGFDQSKLEPIIDTLMNRERMEQ